MKLTDGVYRTADLIEASVLSMHGLTPALEMSGDGRKAVFVFDMREEDTEFFGELVGDISASKCKVEPKRFAREMKIVREALYDFLNVDRGRRRLQQPA